MIDEDQFERRLRLRRNIGRAICGGLLVAATVLLVGMCRETMRDAPADDVEVPDEIYAQADRMRARYDPLPDGVPAGLREAIAGFDPIELRDAPECDVRAPGAARAFTEEELAAAATRAAPTGRREVIVVGSHRRPFAFGDEGTAGFVDGIAYLWDEAAGKIVCAGNVYAESSAVIQYTQQGADMGAGWRAAEEDLAATLDREVGRQLRVVR